MEFLFNIAFVNSCLTIIVYKKIELNGIFI